MPPLRWGRPGDLTGGFLSYRTLFPGKKKSAQASGVYVYQFMKKDGAYAGWRCLCSISDETRQLFPDFHKNAYSQKLSGFQPDRIVKLFIYRFFRKPFFVYSAGTCPHISDLSFVHG